MDPGRPFGFLDWPVPYVGALVEVGRFADAAAVLTELVATATERRARARLAALARLRGELATAQRSHRPARDAFEEALVLGDGVATALERARTQAAYGRFLRRRGERRAAAERLRAARRDLLALGSVPFLQRCEDELAACGASPGEPPVREATTGLTPQEQMVAGLASSGLTNAEIARHLVLSVKTVGYHLAHVYTKLGVHSRAQLVAAWSERG